ncbi:hypothetical protein TI39_contig355g00016 [Zymoseptoria brevis]|uniref:PH domain-containing protein n=1 Tax=Zymoseptoria brevis TaxID=1047168 RepID=A0A0F4GTI3_9PEZI|nr:hypothetical protein TI39_contig355g00016 [Zymoseptoria brevis]
MAAARNSNDSSWVRRRSFFALSTLRPSEDDAPRPPKPKTLSKKSSKRPHLPLALQRRSPSASSSSTHLPQPSNEIPPPLPATVPHTDAAPNGNPTSSASDQPAKVRPRRPSLNMKGVKRPPSVFDSFKSSVRSGSDDNGSNVYSYANGEPLSSTSSTAPSLSYEHTVDGAPAPTRTVLLHGEVQTSAGMFRKKKEYLVLTEVHIIRYKSQVKAAETFKAIPHNNVPGRSPLVKHGSMPSVGSQSDLQTLSDSSGDKHGRVPLRQVVAVHKLDDGKPYFALEMCYLDEENCQASAMTLQFGNPEERDVWLKSIRGAVGDARLRETNYVSPLNLENVARIVERDNDYDPHNCAIFKVVQRQAATKSGSRSSADDLGKVASTVCFLVVGVHKLHLVQLTKPVARASSPALGMNNSQVSHGLLTLTAAKVSSYDDTFELTIRQPLQKGRTLYLASSASYEIAARLHFADNFLRPESGEKLIKFSAPREVYDLLEPPAASDVEEHSCLDRTLIAYCVAYGVNPANVRYTINYACEDAPGFELLPPADQRRPNYGPLELLAIMRALRYNESFGSISFVNIALDSLNGLHDPYGHEHVCTRTKMGTLISRLTTEELSQSSLLVQEIRALAATSKKLRRMDFSGCMTNHTAPASTDKGETRTKDIGCGIVEALFPLCKHQTTNVDWICLNGIELSETDQDYLVGAAVDKSCHFRAIELNRCGLNDRSMGLILDALRVQENTLEALAIAGNAARLNPSAFDSQLGMFGFIRKLNLSNVSRTSGSEPFLQAETLLIWRLQELRLSGTALNSATIDAVSTYLAHPQSESLHELYVDHTYLSGKDVATLLHSLSFGRNTVRDMHLDISQCLLSKGIEQVTQALSMGLTPSHLSMRAIEYREESMFRKVIAAVTHNKTLKFLDMSQTALPGDASEETCKALSKLLAENDTLLELDISGDDSRLATSKFGPGINETLNGLKYNTTLSVFRIEKQRLGVRGASTLAEVLRVNSALLELHCGNNDIPLQGLTDLVNALIDNTTLVHLPPMDDGRAAAFKAAESTMKVMNSDHDPFSLSPEHAKSTSAMKRGFANVRKTAQRSTPSFPNLPYRHASNAANSHSSPSPNAMNLTLPAHKIKHHSPTHSIASAPMPSTNFTAQDIQTTQRLLSEQWDRQCYRLEQYLHRNWCLRNGVEVQMEVEDERFERPGTSGGGKVMDLTPKAGMGDLRAHYFENASSTTVGEGGKADGSGGEVGVTALPNMYGVDGGGERKGSSTSTLLEKRGKGEKAKGLSLKQFYFESEGQDGDEDGGRQRTPTQGGFMR